MVGKKSIFFESRILETSIRMILKRVSAASNPNKAPVWDLPFNLSGHGHVDMASYDAFFAGQLEDFEYPSEAIAESLKHLPKVDL